VSNTLQLQAHLDICKSVSQLNLSLVTSNLDSQMKNFLLYLKSASRLNLSLMVTKSLIFCSHCFRLLTVGKMQLILLPMLKFSSIHEHKNECYVNIRTHNYEMYHPRYYQQTSNLFLFAMA
jgi:hypothetical protein